jgi:hypothetical protein
MTTITEVLDFIGHEATVRDTERIQQVLTVRIKAVRAVRAATIEVGAQVTIKNIAPKALNGLTGTVSSIDGNRGTVTLDEPSTRTLSYARTKYANRIIPGATSHPIGGIPLTCMEPQV